MYFRISLTLLALVTALPCARADTSAPTSTTAPAAIPLKVTPLEGPVASPESYCKDAAARLEASADYQADRKKDVEWREPADRAQAEKHWHCDSLPWPARDAKAGRPRAPFSEVRPFQLRCERGEYRTTYLAVLAVSIDGKWWVGTSDIEVEDRLAAAAGFTSSSVECEPVGKAPGILWRVGRTFSQTHDIETLNTRNVDLHIVAIGPSGKPSMTDAVPLVDNVRKEMSGKRPSVQSDVALTAKITDGGTLTLRGRTRGAEHPEKLTAPRTMSFP